MQQIFIPRQIFHMVCLPIHNGVPLPMKCNARALGMECLFKIILQR